MSNFILATLYTEGTTDLRFLNSVVERTLEQLAYDCSGDIETRLELINFDKTGQSFNNQVLQAARVSTSKYSSLILFVHTDSDHDNDSKVFESKIIPAINFLNIQTESVCKHIVAIVPIQMTESWMIADKELLKSEIGLENSDSELGIHSNPETINNPKNVIENIIRISKEDLTKRKRNKGLDISDLYQIIGQKINLSELEKLSSYNKFKQSLIEKLKELNFYHK
jgi:Domain of unknown function (DUF4276)